MRRGLPAWLAAEQARALCFSAKAAASPRPSQPLDTAQPSRWGLHCSLLSRQAGGPGSPSAAPRASQSVASSLGLVDDTLSPLPGVATCHLPGRYRSHRPAPSPSWPGQFDCLLFFSTLLLLLDCIRSRWPVTEDSHSERAVPAAGGPGRQRQDRGFHCGLLLEWSAGRAAGSREGSAASRSRPGSTAWGQDVGWWPETQPCLKPWVPLGFSIHELKKSSFCLSQFGFDSVTCDRGPRLMCKHGVSSTVCG